MCKLITSLSFLLAVFIFGAGTVLATQAPDLRVMPWQGPASAMVNSPYQYRVTVKNIGNRPASNVKVVVDLPLTDTSPNKHILGKLTGINANDCQVISNKLHCNMYTLNNNQTKFFTFNFELPVSTKTLTFKATASTTTSGDPLGNNVLSHTPALSYGTRAITSSVDVLVSHCTGQGLTSYYECELYPSSIASFTATLSIDTFIYVTGYGSLGNWDQNISNQRLHMLLSDGYSTADFNGFSTGGNCFEGMTTFLPASPYVSPYKVCIQ